MKNLIPILTLLLLLTSCTSTPDNITYEAYEDASYKARIKHVDNETKRHEAQKKVNLRYIGINENDYNLLIQAYEITADSLQPTKDSLQTIKDSLNTVVVDNTRLDYGDPRSIPRDKIMDMLREIERLNPELLKTIQMQRILYTIVVESDGSEPLSPESYETIRSYMMQ